MHIESHMTGKAVFVDAACLDESHPLLALQKATYRALLEGAEPSAFTVVDEEMFYLPDAIEERIGSSAGRGEYLPRQEAEDAHLCCAAWCPACGVLLTVQNGRVLAARLPVPTLEQAGFLRGCRDDLCKMAAQAEGLFTPENALADTLRTLAKKIDIDRPDKILP